MRVHEYYEHDSSFSELKSKKFSPIDQFPENRLTDFNNTSVAFGSLPRDRKSSGLISSLMESYDDGNFHFLDDTGNFYLNLEIGFNFTPSLNVLGDVPEARGTICDQFLNPFSDLAPGFCTEANAPGTEWTNQFTGSGGIVSGIGIGHNINPRVPFRIEVEYFFRQTNYDQISPIKRDGGVTSAKLDGEVVIAEERIGNINSDNFFANIYFDIDRNKRIKKYIGVGTGLAFTKIDYSFLWVRNLDPDKITSIAQYFPPDRQEDLKIVQKNVAGTTSVLIEKLRHNKPGLQVLIGLDFSLSDSVILGLKARGVFVGEFTADNLINRVRSHQASNNLDGSIPLVSYNTIENINHYGVSAALKYQF
ncbi:MAG: hypothetical protein OXC03_03505 [Flavobacteriaceae bacterium]|nr:hypothetical protein [Flavobacteriaceae bacterium]